MRRKRPGRHKIHQVNATEFPDWMLSEDVNPCLLSVGDEAYSAKTYADRMGAANHPSCLELYAAAYKQLARLNNEKLSIAERAKAGSKAARKFWEAKVIARRLLGRR